MTRIPLLPALAAVLALAAGPAAAGCYADYKAKRDNPLRLHYGVVEIRGKDCSKATAEQQIQKRIAADDWKLLTVLGVFDDRGLEKRKESAGRFYLRY